MPPEIIAQETQERLVNKQDDFIYGGFEDGDADADADSDVFELNALPPLNLSPIEKLPMSEFLDDEDDDEMDLQGGDDQVSQGGASTVSTTSSLNPSLTPPESSLGSGSGGGDGIGTVHPPLAEEYQPFFLLPRDEHEDENDRFGIIKSLGHWDPTKPRLTRKTLQQLPKLKKKHRNRQHPNPNPSASASASLDLLSSLSSGKEGSDDSFEPFNFKLPATQRKDEVPRMDSDSEEVKEEDDDLKMKNKNKKKKNTRASTRKRRSSSSSRK